MMILTPRKILLIIVLLLSGVCSAASPYDAWSLPGVEIEFTGTGLESGHVLNMKVKNKSAETVSFQLPLLTVLEPAGQSYAPIVVESKGGWKMPPGTEFSVKLLGFSLNQSTSGPRRGQSLSYSPAEGTRYSVAQHALKKSLEYERSPGLQARLLPPDQHRTIVIQRLIWSVYGPNNPKTPVALIEDLNRQFQARGKDVNTQSIRGLAESIWKDVERIHTTLN